MVGRCVRALQVHVDDGVPVGLLHLEDHPISQDAGVVDEDVEPAEGVHGLLDHGFGVVEVGNVATVHDRLAAHALDLVHDGLCRADVAAGPVDVAAQIVHHDLCALGSEHQRMLPSDAATGSRDDCDSSFYQTTHWSSL